MGGVYSESEAIGDETTMTDSLRDIAKMIDHSLLNPVLTARELEEGCRLALEYDVASVCIMPFWLKQCAGILKGSAVRPSTTIGFPHGGHTTAVKAAEARRALEDGGEELYDHEKDPGEWNNLAANPSYSAQKAEMLDWLHKIITVER